MDKFLAVSTSYYCAVLRCHLIIERIGIEKCLYFALINFENSQFEFTFKIPKFHLHENLSM